MVTDREDDAPPEPVVGRAAVVGSGRKARVNDQVGVCPLVAEMAEDALAVVGGKADIPTGLGGLIQTATGEVIARVGSGGGFQLQTIVGHGLFHDLGQLSAPVGLFPGLGIAGGHLHAGFAGDDLDRLHEADVFGFLDEAEEIALLVATEAVIEPLAVIDVEGCGFFLMEGARRPHVALALVRLSAVPCHLATDHLGQRGAGAQFVDETGRQTHRPFIPPSGPGVHGHWGSAPLACRPIPPGYFGKRKGRKF